MGRELDRYPGLGVGIKDYFNDALQYDYNFNDCSASLQELIKDIYIHVKPRSNTVTEVCVRLWFVLIITIIVSCYVVRGVRRNFTREGQERRKKYTTRI